MKSLKLTLALGATLLAAQAASAQTTVRFVGSTAYRTAVLTAVQNLYGGSANFRAAYVGGSLNGSSQAVFDGLVNGSEFIVKTSFSGSAGGVAVVSQALTVGPGGSFLPQTPDGFLLNSLLPANNGTATQVAASLGATPPSDFESPQQADFAFSDVFQRNTLTPTPLVPGAIVGVVPFVFAFSPNVATPNSATQINNVTTQQASDLLAGVLTLGELNPSLGGAAAATAVQVVGRDEDSGTRITAYAVSGYGISTLGHQFQPLDASNNPVTAAGTTVASTRRYPSITLFTLNGTATRTQPGDAGFSSGGTLATVLSDPKAPAFGAWFGSYLGVSDARNLANGAFAVSLDGVSFPLTPVTNPTGPSNVESGAYNFWGYEHVYVNPNASSAAQGYARQLAVQIRDVTVPVSNNVGIPLNQMQVTRNDDGAPIDPSSGNPPAEQLPFPLQ